MRAGKCSSQYVKPGRGRNGSAASGPGEFSQWVIVRDTGTTSRELKQLDLGLPSSIWLPTMAGPQAVAGWYLGRGPRINCSAALPPEQLRLCVAAARGFQSDDCFHLEFFPSVCLFTSVLSLSSQTIVLSRPISLQPVNPGQCHLVFPANL